MIATKPVDFRNNLKQYMDFAFGGEPVVIARPKNQNVVMVSEKDYNDLVKSWNNAEYMSRIDRSYEQMAKNQTISFSLDELREMESNDWQPSQRIKDFMERENG